MIFAIEMAIFEVSPIIRPHFEELQQEKWRLNQYEPIRKAGLSKKWDVV